MNNDFSQATDGSLTFPSPGETEDKTLDRMLLDIVEDEESEHGTIAYGISNNPSIRRKVEGIQLSLIESGLRVSNKAFVPFVLEEAYFEVWYSQS